MDSTIMRIEPVINRADSKLDIIVKILAQQKTQQHPKRQNDNVPVKELWNKGCILENEGKYLEAIAQFEEVVKQDKSFEAEAYFNIAIAYAKLSHGDFPDEKQEEYKDEMLRYLKKAAKLKNQEAVQLLQKYGEQ
jgi:tetratricopeptide (TPR) repeat protein